MKRKLPEPPPQHGSDMIGAFVNWVVGIWNSFWDWVYGR